MREVLWEIMCQGGTSLALGQYFDHGAVPLDAQLNSLLENSRASWDHGLLPKKQYQGHKEALLG